jgi:hypothetical protein
MRRGDVGRERARRTTPPPAKPAPLIAAKVFTLPSARSCISRRHFRIRIHKVPGVTFVSAVVKLRGKRVKTLKGRRITAPIDLRGLPKGTYRVSITAKTSDGRSVSDARTYHTCASRRSARSA